jgi:glycosyltransferase involved in cell wall biosynthesis
MRLLFVNSIERVLGGAERFTLALARGLASRGHNVALATRGPSRIARAASDIGLEAVPFEMASDWHLATVLALRDQIVSRGVDVVFTTTGRAMMLAGHAAVLAGARGVVARLLPGFAPGDDRARGAVFRAKKRLFHRALVRRGVVNSRAGHDEVVARGWLPPSRVETVYNGVDLGRFPDPRAAGEGAGPAAVARSARAVALRRSLGIPDGHVVVLSLTRFDRHKGQLVELRGAREIIARRPDVDLLFVGAWGGDAAYQSALDEERRAFADPSRVLFLGERDDVPALLEACDVLIRVTNAEGLPNAVLEAMAAGRAVVASRVAGTPEAVADGETGLLVEPGRSDQLAAALERLVARPDERRAMGLAGRLRVERDFRLDATIDAYERLFEREAR